MDATLEPNGRLQEALAALVEAEERGETIDADVWAQRFPEVADDLRVDLGQDAPPAPCQRVPQRVEVHFPRGSGVRNRPGVQHHQVRGVGVAGADERLGAGARRVLVEDGHQPVGEARDQVLVERNHVYVIPPNKYLSISGGRLHLSERLIVTLHRKVGLRAIRTPRSGTATG